MHPHGHACSKPKVFVVGVNHVVYSRNHLKQPCIIIGYGCIPSLGRVDSSAR
jgi:hypothetical protein